MYSLRKREIKEVIKNIYLRSCISYLLNTEEINSWCEFVIISELDDKRGSAW